MSLKQCHIEEVNPISFVFLFRWSSLGSGSVLNTSEKSLLCNGSSSKQ